MGNIHTVGPNEALIVSGKSHIIIYDDNYHSLMKYTRICVNTLMEDFSIKTQENIK
jgi:hypothetical protein